MKKRLHNAVTTAIFATPVSLMLVITAILNYMLGQITTKVNTIYSRINELESRNEFIKTIVVLILIHTLIQLFNGIIVKVSSHRLLNKSYLKWIEKLTYSKVSSITGIGTGGIANAVNTLSVCDKQILATAVGMLPSIIPFFMLCKKEWDAAGILPVIINVSVMILYIIGCIWMTKMPSNATTAKARNKMSAVTTDCILNSKTVKYFQRESWSMDIQSGTQRKTFLPMLNLPKGIFMYIFFAISWIPCIANVYICWGDLETVLFIIMMDYSIYNITDRLSVIMDCYSDKVAQLKVIGKLEPDTVTKKPIEKLRVGNIEFKYSDDSNVTFKIDNITIEKGKRYCITGKSGFGKSTFIKLVTKTVEPTKGVIDAVDTIYMFAESQMFNQSIFNNIALGDDTVTLAEVRDILEHLEVDVDIDLENESVGEKGEKLSTGQIQRINLARVIVYARRHPGVLVALDEVTSALDEITSVNCINYLASEFARLGTTLLYVSNKSDYKDTDLITDNILVEREKNGGEIIVSYRNI